MSCWYYALRKEFSIVSRSHLSCYRRHCHLANVAGWKTPEMMMPFPWHSCICFYSSNRIKCVRLKVHWKWWCSQSSTDFCVNVNVIVIGLFIAIEELALESWSKALESSSVYRRRFVVSLACSRLLWMVLRRWELPFQRWEFQTL